MTFTVTCINRIYTHYYLCACLSIRYLPYVCNKVTQKKTFLTYCKIWSEKVSVTNSEYRNNLFMCLYSWIARNKNLSCTQGAVFISNYNLKYKIKTGIPCLQERMTTFNIGGLCFNRWAQRTPRSSTRLPSHCTATWGTRKYQYTEPSFWAWEMGH